MSKSYPHIKKDTVEMCFFKDELNQGKNCEHKPRWTVSSEKTAFRVCDIHLPWGIRLTGAPALVEDYKPRDEEDTVPIKYDLEQEHNIKASKKTAIAMKKIPMQTNLREEEGGRTRNSDHPFEKNRK